MTAGAVNSAGAQRPQARAIPFTTSQLEFERPVRQRGVQLLGLDPEKSTDRRQIVGLVAAEAPSGRCVQVGRRDHDETDPLTGDELVAACVIECALDSAMNATHSESFGLIEMGHRLVMLPFAVFDNEAC